VAPGGDILGNIALIQFNFAEQEHAFSVKSHGNAEKNKVPYTRTQDSTKTSLRSNLAKATPKEPFRKTTRDLGGTLNARSAGCTPRNRKQAYNMKQMNAGVSQESRLGSNGGVRRVSRAARLQLNCSAVFNGRNS